MLAACVKFYKDVLLLENYAIMNYCGFSKILKKHDKRTGYVLSSISNKVWQTSYLIIFFRFSTRDAYLTKVVSQENFTKYPFIKRQLREIETIFEEIQSLHKYVLPLHSPSHMRFFISLWRCSDFRFSLLSLV